MARKVSCCAPGEYGGVIHVQPGRYQLSFAELLSWHFFSHKENIALDVRALSQIKNKSLNFDPCNITRQ